MAGRGSGGGGGGPDAAADAAQKKIKALEAKLAAAEARTSGGDKVGDAGREDDDGDDLESQRTFAEEEIEF